MNPALNAGIHDTSSDPFLACTEPAAYDLLDVRPFMDKQPLRIGEHGRFEDPSHRRNPRRAFPGINR